MNDVARSAGGFQLEDLTYDEVAALNRGRTVAILPVGAIEAHGPHLPLGTDVIIAQAMARAGARRLEERGYAVLLLPPVVYTSAPFAAGFAGTVSLRPETAADVVVDVAMALSGHGFPVLAIANAHLDPSHLGSMRRAAERLVTTEKAPKVVFPDLTRRPWAPRLTDEFKSGACHAGQFEASIVMAARPELVRDPIRLGLQPNPISLSRAIREGKTTFEEAGGPRAYFGDPAAASADEGRRTIAVLGGILADAVVAAGGKS